MKLLSLVVAASLGCPHALLAEPPARQPALPGLSQQDQHIPNEEFIFRTEGFEGNYDHKKFQRLEKYIETQQAYYENQARHSEAMTDQVAAKETVKTADLAGRFLKHAERLLKELDEGREAFNLGRRLVSATLILDKVRTFKDYPAAAKPVKANDNRLPLTPEEQAKLQATIAQLVAGLKIDPSKAPPELVEKIQIRLQRLVLPETSVVIPVVNPNTAVNFEVGENHPVRVTDKNMPKNAKSAWKGFEEFWRNRLGAEYGKDYGLKSSRAVLFYEGMDSSATSPKFEAKDAWGRKLKVKSGDEVQSEVIANRMWMAMGGKYTDLTYNTKGEELTIILPESAAEISPEAAKLGLRGREALEHAMLTSGYQYRLANNMYSSGVIDKALYATFPKKFRKQVEYNKIKGRTFVRLKEAALEFKPREDIFFGSGAAFSSQLAAQDIVGRTSVLFNLFLGNRDAKDDNNRSVLIKFGKDDKNELPGTSVLRNKDGKGSSYVEYQSDLGNSLGDMFAAGDIQKLMGMDFLKLRQDGPGKYSIRPAEPLLYVPGAWNSTSSAELVRDAGLLLTIMDPLLYGDQYVDFAKTHLGWILSQTNWPQFMQLALANRLVERMRGILTVMDYSGLSVRTRDGKVVTAAMTRAFEPSWTLSEENLEEFARQVDVGTKVLRKYIGVQLLVKGHLTVADARAKELIRLLETERYPSGLVHRVSRTRDHKPQLMDQDIVPASLADIFKRPTAEELQAQEAELKVKLAPLKNDGSPNLLKFGNCEQVLRPSRK